MQFILVNGRFPSPAVFLHVVLRALSRTVMCEKSQRGSPTVASSATWIIA